MFSNGLLNSSFLGEIGHTTVKQDGEPCFCGNHGCLEAMCSESRLLSLFESSSGQRLPDLSSLEKLYQDADKSAQFAINDCAKYLGIGLANLVNLFNPSSLIIDMGDFKNCPSLISVAESELYKRAFSSLINSLEIIKVNSNNDTTVCGMAYTLCDKIFDINCPDNIIE